MDYGKLKRLHDELLHLEGASEMLATSDKCRGCAAENAFLLVADEIRRIRMELFEAVGEESTEAHSSEENRNMKAG